MTSVEQTAAEARLSRNSFDWIDAVTHKRSTPALIAAFLLTAPEAAFAQVPNSLLPHNLSPWGMFLNADIVVKAVMVGLAFASLVTDRVARQNDRASASTARAAVAA